MDLINLKRKVNIEKYRGILELGRQKNKESYLAILKLAEENNNIVKPEDIIERFFKGRPQQLGHRLIKICQINGLLDEKGILTEIGLEALRENKIYLREFGAYDFWITKDPLISQKLINIEGCDIFKKDNT